MQKSFALKIGRIIKYVSVPINELVIKNVRVTRYFYVHKIKRFDEIVHVSKDFRFNII